MPALHVTDKSLADSSPALARPGSWPRGKTGSGAWFISTPRSIFRDNLLSFFRDLFLSYIRPPPPEHLFLFAVSVALITIVTTMAFIQKGIKNVLQKNPNDVVFLSALRTPVTRAKKGGLRDAYDHELLAAV